VYAPARESTHNKNTLSGKANGSVLPTLQATRPPRVNPARSLRHTANALRQAHPAKARHEHELGSLAPQGRTGSTDMNALASNAGKVSARTESGGSGSGAVKMRSEL
jgi:hypothetical protein